LPSIAAYTLGCKVNQYDTDAILRDFASIGFEIRNFSSISLEDSADIYLINTCTVTNISDKKSRQIIGRAISKNPDALIVAYGCYAQVDPNALKKIDGVSMVIGTKDRERLVEIVTNELNSWMNINTALTTKVHTSKRTRAYLKIQDGCDRYCSYCIVPYARGKVVSREISDILIEAKEIISGGCKEIVLAGIQIASYGHDLYTMLKSVNALSGLHRLRLSSLDPLAVNEAFLQCIKDCDKLCNHFHLSLQSGCDHTLERMNRKYTTTQYAQAAKALRELFPDASLTTDIIVGFPSETDDDFLESLAFVEKMGFFRVHVFPYSPRSGTPASSFSKQISPQVKEERSRIMRNLADRLGEEFYNRYAGKVLPVLFESKSSDGYWEGHTTQYLKVRLKEESLKNNINLENEIKNVKIINNNRSELL